MQTPHSSSLFNSLLFHGGTFNAVSGQQRVERTGSNLKYSPLHFLPGVYLIRRDRVQLNAPSPLRIQRFCHKPLARGMQLCTGADWGPECDCLSLYHHLLQEGKENLCQAFIWCRLFPAHNKTLPILRSFPTHSHKMGHRGQALFPSTGSSCRSQLCLSKVDPEPGVNCHSSIQVNAAGPMHLSRGSGP